MTTDLFVLSPSTRQASNPYKHWVKTQVTSCLTSRRSQVRAPHRPLVFNHLQTTNLKQNSSEPLSGAYFVLVYSIFSSGGQG